MKKKILYIHHAGGYGGAPKSMSYIIDNLDKNKFKYKLINITDGEINDFFKEKKFNLEIVKNIRPFHGSTVVEKGFKLFVRNWFFLLPSVLKANRIIKKENPDLIHLNSTCLFAFAIAAKMHNVKVISHVREPLREGIWGAPLRFFCKRNVDGFIAICQNDLDSLKIPKKNKHIKNKIIYNFVDIISDSIVKKDTLKKELKLSENSIVFLYLARFAKSNGWEQLIDYAKKITKKNINYHFVLVGAISKEHFKNTGSKNIHILPFRKDVVDLLQSSDVFICPFTEPHFARGVIEASALGLPVIGSNIGGVTELIRNNITGYLYKNELELFEFVNILGENNEKRIELGLNGIEFAKEKFNMFINLKETYKFYNYFVK